MVSYEFAKVAAADRRAPGALADFVALALATGVARTPSRDSIVAQRLDKGRKGSNPSLERTWQWLRQMRPHCLPARVRLRPR